VDQDPPSTWTRPVLIDYLLKQVFEWAGGTYKGLVFAELCEQPTAQLRAMAELTWRYHEEREERRRQMRAARKAPQHEHTD
jgi:hypothetical protein